MKFMKKYIHVFLFGLSTFNAFSSFCGKEAFLAKDLEILDSMDIPNENRKIYSMSRAQFDFFFPASPLYTTNILETNTNNSHCSGVIISAEDSVLCSTGILLSISEDNFEAVGLTTLHAFINDENYTPRFFPNDLVFHQGYTLSCDNNLGEIGSFAIEDVLISRTSYKDICLIKGRYEYNTNLFATKNSFVRFLRTFNFPKISDAPIQETQEGTIYHYPHNPYQHERQRVNTGKVMQREKHEILALRGSSGAAIFVNNKIIGLHAGSDQLTKSTSLIYFDESDDERESLSEDLEEISDFNPQLIRDFDKAIKDKEPSIEESEEFSTSEDNAFPSLEVVQRNEFESFTQRDLNELQLPLNHPEGPISIFMMTPHLKNILRGIFPVGNIV